MLAVFAYYAGITLNAFATLLCSKLCWHNMLKLTSRSLNSVHLYKFTPQKVFYNSIEVQRIPKMK